MSNRRAHYLGPGERALIMRGLLTLIHEQHKMISEAHAKYKKTKPNVFEDHKRQSMLQIAACDRLRERFRDGSVFQPDPPDTSTEEPPK